MPTETGFQVGKSGPTKVLARKGAKHVNTIQANNRVSLTYSDVSTQMGTSCQGCIYSGANEPARIRKKIPSNTVQRKVQDSTLPPRRS